MGETSRGFRSSLGIGLESTWGTAVEVDEKLAYISETFSQQFAHNANDALVGSGAALRSLQGTRDVPGGFVAYWTYGLAQSLLTHYFGVLTEEASANDHYDMQDEVDGTGLTVAIPKRVSVHEFAGFKPSELVISGTPTDGVRIAATGMARSRSLTSSTNTQSVLDALTPPAATAYMQYYHLVLRVADLADALASGDAVSLGSYTLNLNRNHEASLVNSQFILEPKENNKRLGSLVLDIPRYEADTFLSWHDNHTILQADLTFTSGALSKIIRLPQLLVVSAPPNVSGPGFVPLTITLSLHGNADNANANTGFTFAEEIRIFEADGS